MTDKRLALEVWGHEFHGLTHVEESLGKALIAGEAEIVLKTDLKEILANLAKTNEGLEKIKAMIKDKNNDK